MEYDDIPLPVRRRSLFDDAEEEFTTPFTSVFPEEKNDIFYPIEYIENIRTEIEQWKTHILKTLEEKQQFRIEKSKFQSTTLDESILSPKQQEFFASLNFNKYMGRVQKFCDKTIIFANMLQYVRPHLKETCQIVENKIEKEVLKKHLK